jgi:hypothetical protein
MSYVISEMLLMITMIMIMIKSMAWEYVSKLRPTTGLAFILQMIHEHGESCWNNTDKGKLIIRPPELSGNPTSTVI